MSTEITTDVGRLVSGHPMVSHPVTDDKTRQPKYQKDGVTPMVNFYCGIAIPKGNEQHWNQTPWGQQIYHEAVASWPNGEYNMPTFAWKIDDGDSQIPNKAGKKPCEREGWPGHWIIHASNGFPISCYHTGQYLNHQQISRKEAIKTGDYIRLVVDVRGNNPSQSPGVYINPSLFELFRAGVEIKSANAPDPTQTLGATQGQLPANAQVDTNVVQPGQPGAAPPPVAQPGQAMAPPPVAQQPAPPPAPEILTPNMYTLPDGSQHTSDALIAAGWTHAQISKLPPGGDGIPF